MKNNSNPKITLMKPVCAGCRGQLKQPSFQIHGLYVCGQCFEAHTGYWQNHIDAQRAKGAVFFHASMSPQDFSRCYTAVTS